MSYFFFAKGKTFKYVYDKCELIAMLEKKVMGIETPTSALQVKGR